MSIQRETHFAGEGIRARHSPKHFIPFSALDQLPSHPNSSPPFQKKFPCAINRQFETLLKESFHKFNTFKRTINQEKLNGFFMQVSS